MPKNKLRFDMFTIVQWTAAIAFICAAGASGRVTWTSYFKSLPLDDSSLMSWLEAQGRNDVTVTREDNSVTLKARTNIFNGFERLPFPPWQELGYLRPSGSTRWRMLSGSAYLWIAGLGVLIVLGQIRRRYIKPSQKHQAVDDPEQFVD